MNNKILVLMSASMLSACGAKDIEDANHSPVLVGSPQTSIELNQEYQFRPVATDPDGDRLVFTIDNKPSWAEFDASTGTLSGDAIELGQFNDIRISASDGELVSSIHFSVHVYEDITENLAPVIQGVPASQVQVGDAFSFQPDLSDPNGDELQTTVSNMPTWMRFNAHSNEFSGTPAVSGDFADITLAVSDGELTTTFQFTLTVLPPPNQIPVLTGEPQQTVDTNAAYYFEPQATDGNGDTLTFSIDNKPSWASFDSASGILQGTPTEAGTTSGIVISVTDGIDTVSLPEFQIEVIAVLRDVTLNWQAPTHDSNGSEISGLQGYKIFYGSQQGTPDQVVAINNGNQTTHTLTDLLQGEYFFYMTAIDNQGHESALSEAFRLVVE